MNSTHKLNGGIILKYKRWSKIVTNDSPNAPG